MNREKSLNRIEAFAAEALQNGIFALDSSPLQNFIGQERIIKGLPLEINDLMTSLTDEMMVLSLFRLESGLAFPCFDPGNETLFFQRGQCSVNRIQGKSRHTLPQTPV